MAVCKVVTERHQLVAKLLVDGQPAYRALRAGGYSHWTARKFGFVLRRCWGLREAIRLELERRQHHMRPAPKRKKYDRRPVAQAIMNYCALPEDRNAVSNVPTLRLWAEEKRAERIVHGVPPVSRQIWEKFSDNAVGCPGCGRLVNRSKRFLNMAQTDYVGRNCAGF